MSGPGITLVWIRRDLRLHDHEALSAAVMRGGPVIPVFIHDESVSGLGAAPKFRLGLGLKVFAKTLAGCGSELILRKGPAQQVLRDLILESGASAVYWQRAYDPASVVRDTEVKTALRSAGIEARSFAGHLLHEPWTVETGQGSYYKVYTPFWRAVQGRDLPTPLPAPGHLPAPEVWPSSDLLADWQLGAGMKRGADVLAPYIDAGEAAALDRLDEFTNGPVADYASHRDLPGEDGTSRLSEYLSLGEISPRLCVLAAKRAEEQGRAGAQTFFKQLVWRDFAWHLTWHSPHLLSDNWRAGWEGFPWREDENLPDLLAWKQGRSGIPLVDAGLREMYVTGRMHNRARMVVASYLTKHLLGHWRIGMRWFEECLVDWDPACNAMGWQWVAGCGPDAAPYFRIFNPESQAAKFDPKSTYRQRWIAEGTSRPSAQALSYFDAVPVGWKLTADAPYRAPVMSLAAGRERALAAYHARASDTPST